MSSLSTDRWYDSYYSIIFIEPGLVPQVKGAWTTTDHVTEAIAGMKQHHPTAQLTLVISRCGEIEAYDPDNWLEMERIGAECAAEQEAYIQAGICADCGACSLAEAESGKCKPHPVGDTGDYSCAGEYLWQDQEATQH